MIRNSRMGLRWMRVNIGTIIAKSSFYKKFDNMQKVHEVSKGQLRQFSCGGNLVIAYMPCCAN